MEWTRSETLALASAACATCQGLGLRSENGDPSQPCNCVLRNIFRACHARFRDCLNNEKFMSRVTMTHVHGAENRGMWNRKDEEFVADFSLVSRRALSQPEYRMFKLHYLLGADWKLCCRRLNMERGVFFHELYRIEQRLGRAFRELRPYALYPLNEYFSVTGVPVEATRVQVRRAIPIRPPMSRQDCVPGTKAA